MTRLHRPTIGLLLAAILLTSCADASSIVPGGGDVSGGGGDPGVSIPGDTGSGAPIDHDNPIDQVIKPCDTEEVVGDGPDASVGYSPCPSGEPRAEPVPSPVVPTPGMVGVRPRGWDTADVSADGLRITISFVSGIEPCSVLDHIGIDSSARAVTVTLYEGHDPRAGDVACIEIGVSKQVVVELTEPLGDRHVRDGAS